MYLNNYQNTQKRNLASGCIKMLKLLDYSYKSLVSSTGQQNAPKERI